MITIEAQFPRGVCNVHAFGDITPGSAPVVLYFPDAFGQRPASHAIAGELAAEGWRVLMPDYFYEHAPYEPIEPKSIFEQGPKHDRLMAMFGSITPARIREDTAAMIALANERCGDDAPLGATGYCMGGRFAFWAACLEPRVRFAAAFHAARLAPENEDGPHHHFAEARARFYVAPSGIDPMYDAAEHGRLAQLLRAADTDHVIETYHGVAHGYVYEDIPGIYNEAASRKHMRRLKENFGELFG